jgi:uncharacterized membrane protein
MSLNSPAGLRRMIQAVFVLLLLHSLAWELWWAPLRPGGSWLALKALPLALALPGLARANPRTYRWWSMLILAYVCEAAVRMLSDRGLGAQLAIIELGLASLAFGLILQYMRLHKASAAA